jgi:putative transposase
MMIERDHTGLSIQRQCRLLGIHRSGLYYHPCAESEENLTIMRLLDELYFRAPFYGVRRVTAWLASRGYTVNRKRVARLMGLVGWQTLYRGRRTTVRSKSHPVYPYLLKDLEIARVNHVWSMDITYIPMRRGFLYMAAIIDVHSRYIVGYRISNTMTAEWCTEVMREAIEMFGAPEIVNTDQGSQFTSESFTSLLKENGVRISMDSKGRAIDNIWIERFWRTLKYEHVYLRPADDGVALDEGVAGYIDFYNRERLHQSLGYQTPQSHYRRAA